METPAAPQVVSDLPGLPDSVDVAVVGGGLSGLICARALSRAGREVHVFESSNEIGGRMRTVAHPEGFRLDIGFHILLTGYPAVREELDLERLEIRPFPRTTCVALGGRLHGIGDPKEGASWGEVMRFPLAGFGDKLRLARWASRVRHGGRDVDPPDRTAMEHLRAIGFSSRAIEGLLVPFLSGIFLDRTLSVSSRHMESVVRALLLGPAGLPREGIGAVPRQVAEAIPAGRVHCGAAVESLSLDGDRVAGLTVAGRSIRAAKVVLATAPDEAHRLSGLDLPEYAPLGATVVYFTAPRPPTLQKRLFVRGDREGTINEFAVLTNLAPELAPPGHHLIMGTMLGTPDGHPGDLSEPIRHEAAWWFPHGLTHSWRWLATYKIPYAQWAFPPGLRDRLPAARTRIANLFLAGDYTREPSVQGAIEAGREAARLAAAG